MTEITLEQVRELYEMLQGQALPEGWHMAEQPQLTPGAAFAVIWFLQERLRVIPDHYERCKNCDEVFDTDYGGQVVSADDVDEYDQAAYDAIGVSADELREYEGAQFCDVECEAQFWHDLHNDLTDTEEEMKCQKLLI